MASKQVTDRLKSAAAVLALLDESNAKTLAAAVVANFAPHLATGEQMPDFLLTLRLLWRSLRLKADQMEQADLAHAVELSDDEALLKARDEAAASVSGLIVTLRGRLGAVFGAASLSSFGFRGETPYDATALSNFAKQILLSRKTPTPKPLDEDLSFNPSKSLDALERAQQHLERCLQQVAADKRENQKTQEEKNQAIAAYDIAFSRAANFLVGVFQLADQPALAKKVRPSTRRPGQLIDADGETPES